MRFSWTKLVLSSFAGLTAWCAGTVIRADEPKGKIDYNQHIRPILSDRCFICHGPDENKRKAKLRLDTSEGANARGVIAPGKPDESALIHRITATDDQRMPPRKSNLSLLEHEVELLRRWIAEGAEYKPHWAFLPLPEAVPIPRMKESDWPANPIDNFVAARLEREGIGQSPPASREDWIRRVTFDLTGLPPDTSDVDAFLEDCDPNAFEKVVDRLLASPRFGERMTTEWLDVSRYADSFGYQADGDMHVWPWRDWVIRAFNANLPYDEFITWQLAGDLLRKPTRDQRLATAFNRLHRMTNEGGSIAEEFRNEYVSDRVHTFSTAFLGLTVECARCHDHKYDPISIREYYALGAFFNSIDEWGTYDNSHFRPTPTLRVPTPAQDRELLAKARRVENLSARLRQLEKQREPAFQKWLSRSDLNPELRGLIGDYPLDGLDGKNLENRADSKHPGATAAGNTFVSGKVGQALRFTGDDAANFPHVLGGVERWQPFTLSFWLQLPPALKNGIIFHRQSGTDTGFHGAELSLDDSRLLFALVRFWPGNAIAVKTKADFPATLHPAKWVHVAVTYDGSSKAAGLYIYVNGVLAETEVIRDNLFKDLQTNTGHGGGATGLAFGERFRSPGLTGAALDELRIFDRVLSDLEIADSYDGKSLDNAIKRRNAGELRPYYFAAVDTDAAELRAKIGEARRQLFAEQTAVNEIMTMQELSEPRQAYVLGRGEYDAPKTNPVDRATPAALSAYRQSVPRNRLGLARWLTDPAHPLTARVAVNRYWQLFFGQGLVATPDNLGQQGSLPTHPELLDWLAREFIATKWNVKELCRCIVLSSTYRQRSTADEALRNRDPENTLLSRGPSRRLSAEMLRDAALYSSGALMEQHGGPPKKPYQPPGLWHEQNAFLPVYVADKGAGLYRRSLYTFWRRTSPPPNMLALDAPGREVCAVRRHSTNTPIQPLVLLNDPQFVEAARLLGERMLRHKGTTDAQIAFAFRLAATRKPVEPEIKMLHALFERQREFYRADPAAATNYLKTDGRPVPDDLNAIDLAAAAATASAILNSDAAVTIR